MGWSFQRPAGEWPRWKSEVSDSLYDLDSCFDRRALDTPEGRRKAQLFAALVPGGCRTVLDAGGGTGWATIELRNKCEVVTLESSAESLRHAPGQTMLASIDALPYSERSFDIVICSQVLEHLPGDMLDRACFEMMRVAKDYLLVSVPYREALDAKLVRCACCRQAFHPDHHVRSFTEEDLAGLFPQWLIAEWHVFGPLNAFAGVTSPRPLGEVAPSAELSYARETTVCPHCGKCGANTCPNVMTETTVVRWPMRILNRMRRRFRRREEDRSRKVVRQSVAPYWIAALFVRAENGAPIDADLNSYSRASGGADGKTATQAVKG